MSADTKLEKVIALMSFIDGAYLDNTALPKDGVEVTIKAIKNEEMQNPRNFKTENKKVMYVDEFKWGIVLGAKYNRKRLADMVVESSKELIGKKITIYQDPAVKLGKKTVGAVRIK